MSQAPRPLPPPGGSHPGFPWTGVTLVAVITALLFFMAIPRSVLRGPDLQAARRLNAELRARAELSAAITAYRRDHGEAPGYRRNPSGSLAPNFDPLWFGRQLRQASNAEGELAPERDRFHPLGPYLERGIPPNPLTGGRTVAAVSDSQVLEAPPAADWIYLPASGEVRLGPGRSSSAAAAASVSTPHSP